MLLLFAVQ